MRAEDLLAAVFPDAIACQDNFQGERTIRQIPDHPLAQETIRDCLTEAMDLDGLISVLDRIECGAIVCRAVDTPLPSAFCHEILNANPYAFLDDAPLEERRARAVDMRRSLPPELAGGMGALDQSAIDQVSEESWPVVRDAEEFHDALLSLGWVPCARMPGWDLLVPKLAAAGRLVDALAGRRRSWGGWQRSIAITPGCCFPMRGSIRRPARLRPTEQVEQEEVLNRVVLGWMESIGPTTAEGTVADAASVRVGRSVGRFCDSSPRAICSVADFRFTPHEQRVTSLSGVIAACSPAFIVLTIGRLRKEIEPVTAAEFMRFLFQWQHAAPGARLHGEAGLA
jgi:ATP-dependent Lhr-like helicase